MKTSGGRLEEWLWMFQAVMKPTHYDKRPSFETSAGVGTPRRWLTLWYASLVSPAPRNGALTRPQRPGSVRTRTSFTLLLPGWLLPALVSPAQASARRLRRALEPMSWMVVVGVGFSSGRRVRDYSAGGARQVCDDRRWRPSAANKRRWRPTTTALPGAADACAGDAGGRVTVGGAGPVRSKRADQGVIGADRTTVLIFHQGLHRC